MVTRKVLPGPRPAELSSDKIRAAIPKLERRLAELQALKPESVQRRSDPAFDAIEDKIDTTLVEVFGHDTLDYERFRIGRLDKASVSIGGPPPIGEIREGYRRGIELAVGKLSTALDVLKEKLTTADEVSGSPAPPSLESLGLHVELRQRVVPLFKDGHYANAIEDACKVLDLMVKLRSGRDELSGTDLMQTVFSEKSPVLRFNEGLTETDRGEQRGMMFLYAGTMLALRNPRAHGFQPDDAATALQIISFINFLIGALERTKS